MRHEHSLREPAPRDLIQLLNLSGDPSDTYVRVKTYISYDRHEEIFEVIDSWNRPRFITAGSQPGEWIEVDL